ncbi:hypothetical protein ASE98_04435 [Pseudomonas sp. Leaf48]|uniref:MliC family protein n=1 Tax=Pseudomonas sp. Leaf48 TaxID=1736221 RepID=UPI00072A77D0|nr:MliC family protein [Pseudomonas sp. Leaf48]KQN48639.1 hypothetical protein ASE98_04435 [Pseudomonas sp. Leaf48]
MNRVTRLLVSLAAASACAATSLCAVAAKPAPVFKTSFDCTGTRASVEKLICRDSQLAQMDLELQRLYLLALTDDHSQPPPRKVETDQLFWIDARNQCGSGPEPKVCTLQRYAERAYQLRKGSAIARTRDPSRLTDGPAAFRCAGLNSPIEATYFHVQPGIVFLKWANTSASLSQVPTGSGNLYTSKDARANYRFWQDGNDATFQMPGSGQLSCTGEPAI